MQTSDLRSANALNIPVRSRRVLIVDGAEMLVMLLETYGHTAMMIHDGGSALAVVREQVPHFVFLDHGLPDIDGYEVARRTYTDLNLTQPLIVAVTGWGTERDREQTRAAGFDAHLTKPVSTTDLRTVLSLGSVGTR